MPRAYYARFVDELDDEAVFFKNCTSARDAANRLVMHAMGKTHELSYDDLPIDVLVRTERKRRARRFRCDVVPAAYFLEELNTCRTCGCTDDDACEEGCSWVERDLCSACAQ